MADTSTGDKSEKASHQKLKKARDEGQVVQFLPEHYIAMTNQVLDLLRQQMGAARG